MKNKKHKKHKQKRLRDGMVGLLLLAIILISGTFAWSGVRNMAFNPLFELNHGGRFHDHFAPQGNAGRGAGIHDHQLFAENFGSEYIFVRARLREFASEDGVPLDLNRPETAAEMSINDPNTWPIYLAENSDVNNRRVGSESAIIGTSGGRERVILTLGDTRDERHTFMPTFNHADRLATSIDTTFPAMFDRYRHIRAFEMSESVGHAIDALAGVNGTLGNVIHDEEITDVPTFIEAGRQTGPGLLVDASVREENRPIHPIYPLPPELSVSSTAQGGYGYFTAGETMRGPRLIVNADNHLTVDNNNGAYFTHTAQETLPPGQLSIMTLYQWRNNDRPTPVRNEEDELINTFWVMDSETNSGWFYFAAPIPSGEGTSLLLNQLEVININNRNIEYILHVESQFASAEDIRRGEWEDLPDDVAEIWGMTEAYLYISPSDITLAPGDVQQFTAEIRNRIVPFMEPQFTWSVSGFTDEETNMTIDGLLTVGPHETATSLTLSVTDAVTGLSSRRENSDITIGTASLIDLTDVLVHPGCDQFDEAGTGNATNVFVDETGVEWCVVEAQNHNGQEYLMLISRRVHDLSHIGVNGNYSNRFHYTRYAPAPTWGGDDEIPTTQNPQGPELRTRMTQWFADSTNVSNELRNSVVHTYLPVFELVLGPNAQTFLYGWDETALAMPIPNTRAAEAGVFILSSADLNERLGGNPYPVTQDLRRIALGATATVEENRFSLGFGSPYGVFGWYWLRGSSVVPILGDGTSRMYATFTTERAGSSTPVPNDTKLENIGIDSLRNYPGNRMAIWINHGYERQEFQERGPQLSTFRFFYETNDASHFDVLAPQGEFFDFQTVVVPTSKEGYTFIGWSFQEVNRIPNVNNVFNRLNPPTENNGNRVDTRSRFAYHTHRKHWPVWARTIEVSFNAPTGLDLGIVALPNTIYSRETGIITIPNLVGNTTVSETGIRSIGWATSEARALAGQIDFNVGQNVTLSTAHASDFRLYAVVQMADRNPRPEPNDLSDVLVHHGCETRQPYGTGNATNIFVDTTGIEWCVVESQNHGGQEYLMLIARFAHDISHIGVNGNYSNRFHHTQNELPPIWGYNNGNPQTIDLTGPELRERLTRWFKDDAHVSENLRNRVVHAEIPTLDFSRGTPGNLESWYLMHADEISLSQPIPNTNAKEHGVFILSNADVNVRIAPIRYNMMRTPLVHGEFSSITPRDYWVRDVPIQHSLFITNPTDIPRFRSTVIGAAGTAHFMFSDYSRQYFQAQRPAVWVHLGDAREDVPTREEPFAFDLRFHDRLPGNDGYRLYSRPFGGEINFEEIGYVEREGYTFVGWSWNSNATHINIGAGSFYLRQDQTNFEQRNMRVRPSSFHWDIFAVWARNIDVTFHTIDRINDAILPNPIYSRVNGRILIPSLPANNPIDGEFEFLGWATSPERAEGGLIDWRVGQRIVLTDNHPSDLRLYAVLRPLPSTCPTIEIFYGENNIFVDETGFQWCVVNNYFDDYENEYLMLVSRFTLQMSGVNGVNNNQVQNTLTHVRWPATTQAALPPLGLGVIRQDLGPAGRTRVHTWWNGQHEPTANHVSAELRARAVHANIPRSDYTADVPWASGHANTRPNNANHLSTPIPNTMGANTPVFFLNEAEVHQLISNQTTGRVGNRINDNTLGNSGAATDYWLRSSGNAAHSTARVTISGSWGATLANAASVNLAFRPAIWIYTGNLENQ